MTLTELLIMLEGYQWRQERQQELVAWQTSHLLNVSGKMIRGKVTPQKLLRPATSLNDKLAMFNELERRRALKRKKGN